MVMGWGVVTHDVDTSQVATSVLIDCLKRGPDNIM